MKTTLFLVPLIGLGSSLFANVDVKSIDIYKNRTFINQKLDIKKQSVDLINNIRFEDIRFIIDGNCKVENVSTKTEKHLSDDLTKQIKEVKRDLAYKNSEIKSIKNYIFTLENIKFEKQAVNLENIKSVSSYTKNEISKSYTLLFDLDVELVKLVDKLKQLEKRRDSKAYTKLNYNAFCSDGSNLYANYPVYNIAKSNFFEINANTKQKNVEINNKAYITQRSGYNFENIDLNFYTYNYNNQVVPKKFYPKYLDIKEEPIAFMQADAVQERKVMTKESRIISSPISSYHETTTKSFFKVSNVTLKNAVKTSISLLKQSYDSKASIEIDGYASSKPFYKVEFQSDKLFNTSNSKLYIDSIYVGSAFIKEIKKDKETSLYFGEDRFINVKKDLIKDMKEKPFFSIDKLKTQMLWKYEITNNHKVEKSIRLVERLPISKHEDIKVKLISKTKYTKKEDNGKISYDFVVKPNEKRVIEFGYEVQKPYKK